MINICKAATFGWLCVETRQIVGRLQKFYAATFGWLCVETHGYCRRAKDNDRQPPSGGCVLKRIKQIRFITFAQAATFGWLCVETTPFCVPANITLAQPPSGGCVLKQFLRLFYGRSHCAATFGWLCVETKDDIYRTTTERGSHLRVAVC